MKRVTTAALLAAAAALLAVPAGASSPAAFAAAQRIPPLYRNCTALNKKYPHGLGKVGARDRTSGKPVTNFRRSNRLYALAMSYNRGLDRDRDGIACERA